MTKKLFTFLCILNPILLQAQQDTVWRTGGLFSLNFTQVSLTNWAGGGQSSIAGNAIVNYQAHYKKGRNAWDNNIDLGYGLILQGKNKSKLKSDDKIDISSKIGREGIKHLYYSFLLNFRTQFTAGYNYPNDTIAISRFLAPGYLLVAPGIDYKPNNYLSVFISPATTRFIAVNDKILSEAGAFGVDSGKILRTEFGAYFKAIIQKELNSHVNLQSSLDLFSNYIENPQNIDINWQLLLSLKINKFLSASISTQLIYDDNTQLTFYKGDGTTIDRVGPGIQFKEVFGIGFAYKFSSIGIR